MMDTKCKYWSLGISLGKCWSWECGSALYNSYLTAYIIRSSVKLIFISLGDLFNYILLIKWTYYDFLLTQKEINQSQNDLKVKT